MRSCEFLSRVFRYQYEFIRRVAMLNSLAITLALAYILRFEISP